MTERTFHAWLTDPATSAQLDHALAESRAIDERERRAQNERIHLDHIRRWFREAERRELSR